MGEQLLINIDQIIPTPEARELMIVINAKEAGEKTTEVVVKNRHTVRREYWEKALDAFQKSQCNLYDNISPCSGLIEPDTSMRDNSLKSKRCPNDSETNKKALFE